MNKQLLLSLSLAVFSVTSISTPAFASKEGRLTINGKVPQLCEIAVKATDKARDILDISKGDTSRLVGYVYERCNDPNGYTVDVVGINSQDHTGLFIDKESGGVHPFVIGYGGTLVKKSIITDSDSPQVEFLEKPVTISYGENLTLPSSDAFTYVEVMKFTISAK